MGEVLARIEGFPAPGGLLDLEIRRGTVVLLAGRNGSGKTSLLRCLAGLPAPLQARRVVIGGDDPALMPAKRLAATVGVVHQEARDGLVGLTTAGEYRFRGLHAPPGASRQDVATLSNGEARRLALDLARGPLLLLDEPTEGLDADGIARLRRRIAEAQAAGCVVVVDPEGGLADLADVHVDLDPVTEEVAWRLPPAGRDLVMHAPDVSLERGPRHFAFPALSLGAGLHVVTGPNGCGKTTWLRCLAGLEDDAGARLAGQAASMRPGTDVRWLSPHADDHLTGTTVAHEIGGEPPSERGSLEAPRQSSGPSAGSGVDPDPGLSTGLSDALARLVPAGWRHRHPLRLSGGQRKRVALAKVLGRSASLYLLDEPEAHLDAEGRQALQQILAVRIAAGNCIIAATHDRAVIDAAHTVIELPGAAGVRG